VEGYSQRPKHHEFAFTGIFKCGSCGSAITAEEHIKPSGRRYAYYRCTRTRATSERCAEPAVPEPQLVNQISRTLGRLSIPDPVLVWMKRKMSAVLEADHTRGEMVRGTLEETIRSTDQEIANLLDLRLRSIVPDEVFTRKNQELEQRKIGLQKHLATATEAGQAISQQINEVLDFAVTVQQNFVAGPAVRQRAILEAIGSNYLLRGGKMAFHLEKPLSFIAEASGCSNWGGIVDDVRTWLLTTTEYFRFPMINEISGAQGPLVGEGAR
jgi:site-specific DNA recombinase